MINIIHITHTDGICIIRLNRPEIRNALVMDMREELLLAFQKLEVNEEVKCIVLIGGAKHFLQEEICQLYRNLLRWKEEKGFKEGMSSL